MPRKSRASITSNFVHVMVQGINKEFIFEKDYYKKKYLNLLFSNLRDFNIFLISNCVMDNHSHCIFYFRNIDDISKLMHMINTSYAKWYNDENNRVGYVFRDRYKVEEIQDLHHLYSCIKYIHNNPVKAGIVNNPLDYKYSSYKDYVFHSGIYNNKLVEILQLSEIDIRNIILTPKEDDGDYTNLNELKISDLTREVQKFIIDKKIDIKRLEGKKKAILFLKNSYDLNNTEISKIMKLNRKTVYRALRSNI